MEHWSIERMLAFGELLTSAHQSEWRGSMPIDKPFAYHKPSVAGLMKITALREAYSAVQQAIQENCPDSRQKSVAITELETSAMWAIKAVVFNDPESEVS